MVSWCFLGIFIAEFAAFGGIVDIICPVETFYRAAIAENRRPLRWRQR